MLMTSAPPTTKTTPSIGLTWRVLPALALALGSIACDPGNDAELDEQNLTEDLSPQNRSYVVNMANGVQRQFTGVWKPEPRCRKMKNPYSDTPRTVCAATQPGAYLSAATDAPFGARWGNQPYQGCGVAAAYNVLAYFGAANPWPAGIRFTKFSDGRIMSVPSQLRTDLENALNNQANGRYSVELFNGTPASRIVASALASGGVVVALVNNGTHWQTITGMRDSGRSDEWARTIWEFYALDYDFSGVWRTEAELDLELHGWDNLGSILGGGDAVDYRSDTFLIVRKNG
jgi:hypothetical protein